MQIIVAIDIGTTGAKAALVGQDGRLLASGYASYATHTGESNRVEQAPGDWWAAICTALTQLWAAPGVDKGALAAVALSGQMQDLILLGAEDALGAAMLYSDSRAQVEADEIEAAMGAAELLRITGNQQGAASLLAKWRWLQRHEPDRLVSCHTLLFGAHSYIGWRLSGATACDYTTASTTGLFDLGRGGWASELLEQVGLEQRLLPALLPAAAQIGVVTSMAAVASGLPVGLPVYAGAGDLAATTVGVGAGEAGRLYGYLGASGWIATSLEQAIPNPQRGVFTLRHPDPARFIQVAPMLTAGGNLAWVRDHLLAMDNYAVLNQLAAQAPVGSHGLLYLPYLAGERSPFHDPYARAGYIGISPHTQRGDLVRAVMEGTALAYRSLLDALAVPFATLSVVGGGARSAVWMQILADVLGCPVQVAAEPENAAARGVAIIVGRALGWYASFAPAGDFFPIQQPFTPGDAAHQFYDQLYPIFAGLYPQLRTTFAQVAQLLHGKV